MASTVSFKQACPSCEALVPIRDPKLVGKKTECPKCKYRFVVEAPEDDSAKKKADKGGEKGGDKAAAKKGKKDKPEGGAKKKKGGGSSNTVMIGAVVGVVAILALGIGGYFLFFSGSSSPKPNNNQASTNPPITPGPGPEIPGPDGGDPPGPDGMNPTPNQPMPTPTPGRFAHAVRRDQVADISNLLPGETQTVWNLNVDRGHNSIFRVAALQTPGAFRDPDFQKTFGFAFGEVQRVVVGQTERWVYAVVRVAKPLNFDDLSGRLKLAKEAPENGHSWFTVHRELDSLSNLLLKGNRPTPDLAVCFADPQTMVFSNQEMVVAFLNANGSFPLRSQGMGTIPEPGTGTGTTVPGTGGPMPGGPVTMPMPGGPMPGGPVTMPMPGEMPGMTEPNPFPPAGPRGGYLTIEPLLKGVLDRAEGDKGVIFSRTYDVKDIFDSPEMEQVMKRPLPTLPGGLVLTKDLLKTALEWARPNIKRAGFAVHELTEDKVGASLAVDLVTENLATLSETTLRTFVSGGNVDPNGGMFPGGQPGFPMPGFPMPGFPMPGEPGVPGQGGQSPLAQWLYFQAFEKTLIVTANVPLPEPMYRSVRQILEGYALALKSDAEMANTRSRAHELARATQKYLAAKGAFPRGTIPRAVPAAALTDWAPDQCMSWVVDLLPFLGEDYSRLEIDPNQDWTEPMNLQTAQVTLPQLVARGKPGDAFRVRYPGRPEVLGPTAWVGIAGVGFDAATYRGEDEAVANRVGIFGYHRVTKKEDVKDGLGQTILLIQVPAGQRAPWILGGGGTVRGVSEDTESFIPFISAEHPVTKEPGAYAVMADGKVRFLKASITPDQFRALCTIAGDEKIENLDEFAPVVPPPAGEEAEPVSTPTPAPVAPAPTPAPTAPTLPIVPPMSK